MEGTDGVGGAGGFMPVPHHGPLEGQRLVVDAMRKHSWWEEDSHAAAHPGQPNNCVVEKVGIVARGYCGTGLVARRVPAAHHPPGVASDLTTVPL